MTTFVSFWMFFIFFLFLSVVVDVLLVEVSNSMHNAFVQIEIPISRCSVHEHAYNFSISNDRKSMKKLLTNYWRIEINVNALHRSHARLSPFARSFDFISKNKIFSFDDVTQLRSSLLIIRQSMRSEMARKRHEKYQIEIPERFFSFVFDLFFFSATFHIQRDLRFTAIIIFLCCCFVCFELVLKHFWFFGSSCSTRWSQLIHRLFSCWASKLVFRF